jgi:glucokinase
MRSFLEKSPMDALIARMPVTVILNRRAGLLGAASYASRQSQVDSH